MGTMITGWDKTGPHLYYVDNDALRIQGDLFSVGEFMVQKILLFLGIFHSFSSYFSAGSGSTYAYGVLDSYYHKDLTVPEAIELGKRAILHATHRDAYSGGINNGIDPLQTHSLSYPPPLYLVVFLCFYVVYHVGENGWTKVWSTDTHEMFYEYYPVDQVKRG